MKSDKQKFYYFHGRLSENGQKMWIFVCRGCKAVFEKPDNRGSYIDITCPKCMSIDQVTFLEKKSDLKKI